MTHGSGEALRVALLHHSYGSPPRPGPERLVYELGAALRDAGHHPCVFSSHPAPTRRSVEGGIVVVRARRLSEAPLRRRMIAGPLTHLPFGVQELATSGYDLAHSFSAPDALAGLVWRRLSGHPTLFTCAYPLHRARLADRRLRVWLLSRAVEDSDAVVAPSEQSREALRRWLAADAPVIEPHDAAGHERLYRALLAVRGRGGGRG